MKITDHIRDTAGAITPVSWLAFFRVNIALFALLHFAAIQPDFADLFSYHGYIYPDILDVSAKDHIFTITSLSGVIVKFFSSATYSHVLIACRVLYPVFLLLLLVGLFTRVSAIMALLLQLILTNSICLYQYGVDTFTTISLFYCCLFPIGKVSSLDVLLFRKMGMVKHGREFLFLLRAHMGLVYFFSGLSKIVGESWRDGEAIWKTLHQHNNGVALNVDWLAGSPFFFMVGWLTVAVEILYPLLMSFKATRNYCLAAIVLLHIMIAVFLGLYFFAVLMIILNLTAYYIPFQVADLADKAAARTNRVPVAVTS